MHTHSREIAHDSTDAGRQLRARSSWLWPATGCAAVVLFFALGAFFDQVDSQRALAEKAAFDEGRRAGQADMIKSTETAWKLAESEAERCAAPRKGRP